MSENENEIENSTNEISENKSLKKKSSFKNIKRPHMKASFSESYDKFQTSIPAFLGICLCAFALMCFAAFAIFFVNVKGPEKVLVPNVVGKNLEDALLEMQVKELYPKISLRYSDLPGDEGTILDQSPDAGAIVKGYSRVSLVVSRGVIVDKIDEYTGMNIEDLRMKLQTLFAGQTKPLIVLAEPEYKPDVSDAGTILEQDPPAGTHISEPVTVQLVVSRGPNFENTKAPYLIGQTVNDLLQIITRSKLVFDIAWHKASDEEKPGTVVDQQAFEDEFVPNYTRVAEYARNNLAKPEYLTSEGHYMINTSELMNSAEIRDDASVIAKDYSYFWIEKDYVLFWNDETKTEGILYAFDANEAVGKLSTTYKDMQVEKLKDNCYLVQQARAYIG